MKKISSRPSMALSDETRRLCRIIESAYSKSGNYVRWVKSGGGSDANNTSALGIPVLDGFGPAGGNEHGDAEFIDLDSVELRIRLLQDAICTIHKQL